MRTQKETYLDKCMELLGQLKLTQEQLDDLEAYRRNLICPPLPASYLTGTIIPNSQADSSISSLPSAAQAAIVLFPI